MSGRNSFNPFVLNLLIIASLSLSSCTNSSNEPQKNSTSSSEPQKNSTSGIGQEKTSNVLSELQKYASPKGYEFLHPTNWKPEAAKSDKVDILLRDSAKRQGNLYVVISPAPKNKKGATDLGTDSAFGDRFLKGINSLPNSENKAELIGVKSRKAGDKTFYIVEYKLKLPNNREQHNLASTAVSQVKLFTFTLSTPQKQWDKFKDKFEEITNSFSVK